MIEFFISSVISDRLKQKKDDENIIINNMFNNKDIVTILYKDSINLELVHLLCGIIALIISIFSAKLAFNCNKNKSQISQITSVLFAFFFSSFYLLYYFIWHVLLQNKC